jgi:hypothetical protein
MILTVGNTRESWEKQRRPKSGNPAGFEWTTCPVSRQQRSGYEPIAMIRKRQFHGICCHDMPAPAAFVTEIFPSTA